MSRFLRNLELDHVILHPPAIARQSFSSMTLLSKDREVKYWLLLYQALKAEWVWPGADVPFSLHFRMTGQDLTFPMCSATRNASKWLEGWSLVSGGTINGLDVDLEQVQEAATIDGKLLEFSVRLWILPCDAKHWKVSAYLTG